VQEVANKKNHGLIDAGLVVGASGQPYGNGFDYHLEYAMQMDWFF
jgi:hypothetical protein